jgi:hypothetical protein
VTDDDLLSLFSFDPADLLDFPVTLSAAKGLAPSFTPDALAFPFLPPIGGGAPDIIGDFGDALGDLWGFITELPERIKRAFQTLWGYIWRNVGGALRWVWDKLDLWWQWLVHTLQNIFTSAWNWIWQSGVGLWDRISSRVGDVWHWLNDRVGGVWGWLSDAWGGPLRWVWDRVHDVWLWLNDAWGGPLRWVWDRFDDVWRWLNDPAAGPLHWVWARVHDVWLWLNDAVGGPLRWVWDALLGLWEWIIKRTDWVRDNILPPIMGGMGDIGDAFREAFDRIGKTVKDALDELRDSVLAGLDALRDAIVAAIKWPYERAEDLIEAFQGKLAIPGKLFRGQYSSVEQILDDAMDPLPLVGLGLAAVAFVAAMVVSMAISSAWQTFVTPMLLPYQQAAVARTGAALLTVGVIQQALNRGFIDEATAADHLARAGYSGSAKQAILELRNLLPGPSDLIHMAVHEVFNPSLRETLTLDAEFPDPFLPWALKLGYSEEWARNFWADHWDLPSPSQGYEMLHRGLIDMPMLTSLIKALDYAPVWRQHLIDIAYNPITRVDLRRLYKNKIITEEEVFNGYKAQGYNDQNARYLTDFTKKFYSPDDKSQLDDMADLAVSTFRTAYRRHVITRDEALDRIVEAGYTEDVADFLLAIDDAQLALNPTTEAGIPVRDLTAPVFLKAYREKLWDRARTQTELEAMGYLPWEADLLLQLEDLANERELTDLEETVVKEQYLANAIDRAAAAAQLDALQVLPERRDLLLQRWDLQRAQKPKRLTLAQLQKAFKVGLFTEAEFLDEVSAMGYNDRDVQIILAITPAAPAE